MAPPLYFYPDSHFCPRGMVVCPILSPDKVCRPSIEWICPALCSRPCLRVLQKGSGLKGPEKHPPSPTLCQKHQGALVPFFLGSFSCEPVRVTAGIATKHQAGHCSARGRMSQSKAVVSYCSNEDPLHSSLPSAVAAMSWEKYMTLAGRNFEFQQWVSRSLAV